VNGPRDSAAPHHCPGASTLPSQTHDLSRRTTFTEPRRARGFGPAHLCSSLARSINRSVLLIWAMRNDRELAPIRYVMIATIRSDLPELMSADGHEPWRYGVGLRAGVNDLVQPSHSVMTERLKLAAPALAAATCARGATRSSGLSHWQLDRTLILVGGITAAQSGWGVRGSNPEPTD
jgi:hypothetical protein